MPFKNKDIDFALNKKINILLFNFQKKRKHQFFKKDFYRVPSKLHIQFVRNYIFIYRYQKQYLENKMKAVISDQVFI